VRMYLTAKSRSRFRQAGTTLCFQRAKTSVAHWAHPARDDGPVLVWQADTRRLNPTVPDTFITHSHAADAVVAAVEDGAEFRRDIRRS